MSTTQTPPSRASRSRATPESRPPRIGLLGVLVVMQAALLPALGIPMFFRNEAGWHYLLWQRTGFWHLFDGFLGPQCSMGNAVLSRPLVRILEWSQVRLFGLASSWYIGFNGLLFAGFALALFGLALWRFGAATAVLSVLVLMTCFQVIFYPVLNAIYGLQYPLEMLLATAAVLCFLQAFEGRPRRAALGAILSLLAFVTHAATAIVLPWIVTTLALASRDLRPRTRWLIAGLSPLAMGVAFALERAGVPGGLMGQVGLQAKLQFLTGQLAALGALALKPPAGPLLIWSLFDLAWSWGAPGALQRLGAARPAASLALSLPLFVVLRRFPVAAIPVVLVLILLGVARRRPMWFLFTWSAIGVGLFVLTPERNASYSRHFAVPAMLLMAASLHDILLGLGSASKRLRARLPSLESCAAAATVLLLGGTLLATRVHVPGLSSKLEQVRYVGDLGLNFRDAMQASLSQLPRGGQLVMFAGRSRDEEMRSLYGPDYFARLQPAKSEHYGQYAAVLGRPDVAVTLVDPGPSGVLPAGRRLLAVNPWEVEAARQMCHCEPRRLLTRGRASAALF